MFIKGVNNTTYSLTIYIAYGIIKIYGGENTDC